MSSKSSVAHKTEVGKSSERQKFQNINSLAKEYISTYGIAQRRGNTVERLCLKNTEI